MHAGITLLAPQASLDHAAPIIDLDETIRVPVYQTEPYNLADIIHDQSSFKTSIDTDITEDSDGNGTFDDDFVTLGSGASISERSLVLGPFDSLGTRQMIMKVQDAYMNTTLSPLRVEVYAPIPTITNVTATGMLYGSIVSRELNEPIHFLRIR